MKKQLITLAIIGLSLAVSAQTKIGIITISDSVAQKYFLDCFNHPDTVYDNDSVLVSSPEFAAFFEKQKELEKINIGKVYHHFSVPASKDTIIDGMSKYLYKLNGFRITCTSKKNIL